MKPEEDETGRAHEEEGTEESLGTEQWSRKGGGGGGEINDVGIFICRNKVLTFAPLRGIENAKPKRTATFFCWRQREIKVI